MPTKKKPKWGYEGTYLLSDDGIRIYSDAVVKKLAKKYGVKSKKQIEEIKDRLEGAALVYRKWKQNHDDAPRRGEMIAALDEIEGLAMKLEDRLKHLDDETASIYWLPETELNGLSSRRSNETKTRYGHTITRIPD